MKKSVFFIFLISLISTMLAQTPAFPGAEGFGRYATGGRGGTIYYVNNLTDINSGNSTTHEGSLRWCLNQNGTKTILFKVSGTIMLTSNLSITKSNVSILGQSAPGDGICIGGFPFYVGASNVIIRFLRFRMGEEKITYADGADAFGTRKFENIIIDHCSMSWSTDECVSIYEGKNTTLQWCIISESLRLAKHSKGPHGYGGIWGGENASFHHNLMANHDSRTPRFGPGASTLLKESADMRNCVIYNWGGNGCYGAEAMNVNIVNNYYKPGPATPTGSKRGRIIAIDKKVGLPSSNEFSVINDIWGKFFIEGNYVDGSTSASSSDKTACINATADNWTYGVYNQIASTYGITTDQKAALKVSSNFPPGVVTTHTAEQAYEKVLAYAGCSFRRDSHDTRIVNETSTGIPTYKGLSQYNGLGSVTYPAGTVIGTETLAVTTTIDWKSTVYPKWGIIDSETDIKPAGAASDWTPWPVLASGTAVVDTDRDGIADGWLAANFPGKLATDKNEDGYTYLEVYLADIVKDITENQLKDALTDVKLVQQNNTVKIVYDQFSGRLIISTENQVKQVQLFSVNGKLIVASNTTDFSVSKLPAGVYLAKVHMSSGETIAGKFVKL